MYRIAKQFTFCASHSLDQLDEGHKCHHLHGHNYVVEAQVAAPELDDRGFVMDFGELSPLKEYIDRVFDHKHLNDVVDSTTSESLAFHFFSFCQRQGWPVVAVRVMETGASWAEYSE